MSERHPLFGTDGVRGLANSEPVSTDTILRLGRAVAILVTRQRRLPHPSIIIGCDTRRSSGMLEAALAAGVASAGADALLVGEVPTPAVAFLTRSLHAAAGAVVSASHNPFEDNGVKCFASDGFKLSNTVERELEEFVCGDIGCTLPTGASLGVIRRVERARNRYERFLLRQLPKGFRLDGVKVAIDCAHGAAFRVGPRLFEGLGARVAAIGISPDGLNINRDCGAVEPDKLRQAVRSEHADVGVALDGDADRMLLVDGQGEIVDGDETLAILGLDLLRRGRLPRKAVVGTVMSNMGLEVALRDQGISLIRAPVGDRYVVEQMRHHGINLGGEPSGHIVLLDQHTTGDGLLAALMVAKIVRESGKTLATLKRAITKFPQVQRSVRVNRRPPLEDLPVLQKTLRRIDADLSGRGRVLVRFSGTEPVVRVMVEGEEADRVEAFADEIASVLQGQLGSSTHADVR